MIGTVLAFILSPLGRIAMIALGILAAVVVIDRRATYRERAKCDAANLRAQIAALQRDAGIQRDTAKLAREQAAQIEQEKDSLNQKVTDYEIELAKRPGDRCRLTPDDIKRLREIR